MKLAWMMAPLVLLGVAAAAAAPKGALIGRDGFATILRAPPSPTGDVVSTRPTYNGPIEFYAQEEGVSIPEARKRISEELGFRPIFERLEERLKRLEPDNYVSARIERRPDLHYVLSFKRDPQATLARYTVNSRFQAAKAAYSEAELKAIVEPWARRFHEARIGGDYSLDGASGRVVMAVNLTEADYGPIAEANEWGMPPAPIVLGFAPALHRPRVDPAIARQLRGFASESRSTAMQMEAGFSGRVVLDHGCLRLAGKGKARGPLVIFHRETGIGLDAQGYLATIDRRTGKATGRIGEPWVWAGPNPGSRFDGLEALKAACGDGPVINVGNPESEARSNARHAGAN